MCDMNNQFFSTKSWKYGKLGIFYQILFDFLYNCHTELVLFTSEFNNLYRQFVKLKIIVDRLPLFLTRLPSIYKPYISTSDTRKDYYESISVFQHEI